MNTTRPITPYRSAIRKKDASIPRVGSRRKPPASAPSAAPVVLARVSTPVVAVADGYSRRSAEPARVKKMPDRKALGSMSGTEILSTEKKPVISLLPNGATNHGKAA